MNNTFKLIAIIAISIFAFTSCSKDEINQDDEFYVRYDLNSEGAYQYFSNWSVSTPDGSYSKNGYQVRSWNGTYGPVKKGFNCSVRIGNGTPKISISISKNNGPFSEKLNKVGSSASYIIK